MGNAVEQVAAQPLGLLHHLGLAHRLDEMLLFQHQRELERERLDRLAALEIERFVFVR